MKRATRVLLSTLGLAAVVYGAASLTGGWLGTPPWWEAVIPMPPGSGAHVVLEASTGRVSPNSAAMAARVENIQRTFASGVHPVAGQL